MTFADKEASLDLIIKNYKQIGNGYEVEYLDGSISKYIGSKEEYKKLREKMIKQAKERQEKIDIMTEVFLRRILLGSAAISAVGVAVFRLKNDVLFECISLAALFYFLYKSKKTKNRINELKKYKMFLNVIDKLDVINDSQFLKCVEFDHYYQIKFDINTLDDYSYADVKRIYKKINKQ